MMGCCRSGIVASIGLNKPLAQCQKNVECEDATKTWAVALRNTQQRQTKFYEAFVFKRESILETFARMQAAVTRIQQDALAEFDADAAVIKKHFETELVSFEVFANQAAAAAAAHCVRSHHTQEPDSQLSKRDATNVPGFVQVPFQDVESILEACWSIAAASQSSTLSAEMVHLDKACSVVKNLYKISAIANANLQSTAVTCDENMGFKPVWKWEGKLCVTYDIKNLIGGIAVNDSASLLAVSGFNENAVAMYQLQGGKFLTQFGRKGNSYGEFNGPLRLCFTPAGTLLVADSNNKRVQEVTTRGDHVRFLQSDVITGRVLHVTCNADVIVAAQNSDCPICVFDMWTGKLLRNFGSQLCAFFDIGLGVQGTTLMIAETENNRILGFDLDGTFSRLVDLSGLGCVRSVVELPCGRIVAAEYDKSRLAIVHDNGLSPHTRLLKANAGPHQTC